MVVGLEKPARKRSPKTTNIPTPRPRSAAHLPHSNLVARQAALHSLFSALVNLFGEFTLIIDWAGNIVHVSSSADSLRNLTGKRISSLLDKESNQILDETLTRISASGCKEYSQCRLELPGGPRWFQALLVPFTDHANGVYRIGLFANDVTERKESLNALRHKEALLRQAEALAQLGSFQLDLRSYELTWSESSIATWRSILVRASLGLPS